MLEPPFNEFAGLQACNFIKETPTRQVFSREIRKISKNTYSEEHLRTTASVCYNKNIHNRQKQPFTDFLKITEKQLCRNLFFNKVAGHGPANLLKRKTPPQVLFSKYLRTPF